MLLERRPLRSTQALIALVGIILLIGRLRILVGARGGWVRLLHVHDGWNHRLSQLGPPTRLSKALERSAAPRGGSGWLLVPPTRGCLADVPVSSESNSKIQ